MKTNSSFTQAELDNLLEWLSPDRDEAGRKYLEIREGLVRYFRTKGCFESQSLVDETINRVAHKLSSLDTTRDLKPITYFYGFAKNIFLEYLASLKKTPVQLEPELIGERGNKANEIDERSDLRFTCLDDCMSKLKDGEPAMMLAYFAHDRSEKFEARRRLAHSLNINIGNLHLRIHRVKNNLRNCVENCIEKA